MTVETQQAGTTNPGEGAASNENSTTTATQQDTGATGQPGSEGKGEGGAATGSEAAGSEGKGGNANPTEDGAAAGAPEQYEAFQLAEGFALDGDRLKTATDFFKANNWTQEQAQQAINLYTSMAGEDANALQQALDDQRTQQIEQWGQQAKAQLGDKYDTTVSLATTAVKFLNDPELTKAFEEQGWGNHPALINAFGKFGEFLRDSPMDAGGAGGGGGAPKSLAERMYPAMGSGS